MATNKGYIKLYRSHFEGYIWQHTKQCSWSDAWLWLLAKANYAEECVVVEVGGNRVEVQRGQLLTTYRNLAKAWGWSVSMVQRFLTKLEKNDTVKRYSIPQFVGTLIDITNYQKYNPLNPTPDTLTDTESEENRYNLRYINKEIVLKKETKKYTHTLLDLIRGVWGEDAIFLMTANGKEYRVSPEVFATYCIAYPNWLAEYCPSVANLQRQLTLDEFRRLVASFDIYDLSRVLVAMQNSSTIKRRTSVYHTLVSFLNRDFILADRRERQMAGDHWRPPQEECRRLGVVNLVDYRTKMYPTKPTNKNGKV